MGYDGSCHGIVEETSQGKALVRVDDAHECARCGADGTCTFARPREGRSLWALDPLGVEPGDRVKVELSSEGLLAGSFILYGLPLACLLLGALLGQLAGGETRSFLGALVGLAASVPLVRIAGDRIPVRAKFTPRVVAVERSECP